MSSSNTTDLWLDFQGRCQQSQRRARRRAPKPIGDVLDELIVRRGYGRLQAHDALQQAWQETVAGPLAKSSELGALRRGILEVVVANSTVMQEFAFEKQNILKALAAQLPSAAIRDLRFRVGSIRPSE